MRPWLAVLAAGLLGLTGCVGVWWTDIQGEVTPKSPKAADCFLDRPTRVESLRPAFLWEPVAEPDAQYDFIIFEAYKNKISFRPSWIIGREVHYREGLAEPEHQLDDPLRPQTYYFWSVRVRIGRSAPSGVVVGADAKL
jgi:hypothetical protein